MSATKILYVCEPSSMVNPSVNSAFSSFTTGLKYEFIVVWFGSFGPGIIPVIMIFSGLKRRDRGKFKMTKYKTPTL